MANLDTANKRGSAIGLARPPRIVFPVPDGSLSQADRQQTAHCYPGILASAAVPMVGKVFMVPSHHRKFSVSGHERDFELLAHDRTFMVPAHQRTFTWPKRKRDV